MSLSLSLPRFCFSLSVLFVALFPSLSSVCALRDTKYDLSFLVNADGNPSFEADELPTKIQYKLAAFGGNIISESGSTSVLLPLVLASPVHGCAPLVNRLNSSLPASDYYRGKIVLMDRSDRQGSCTFTKRVYNIIQAGGVAGMMSLTTDQQRYPIPGTQDPESWHRLPTLVVDFSYGKPLMTALTSKPSLPLLVSIPSTGPAHPAEWSAMREILGGLTWEHTPNSDGSYKAAQDWPAFINITTTQDPCLNRLVGTVCVGGRFVGVNFESTKIKGSLSPLWGTFSAIENLLLNNNPGFGGDMPCEWGRMNKLKFLDIEYTGIRSLSPCLSNATDLGVLNAGYSSIVSIPSSFSSFRSMFTFYISHAAVTGPMINITNWLHTLEFFDVSYNQITGLAPSVKGSSFISEYKINSNQFNTIDVDAFDNVYALYKVNISDNQIYGQLPTFDNTIQMIEFEFHHNQFYGDIPTTWSWLGVSFLGGSYNRLNGSLSGLTGLQALSMTVDLSHNDLFTPPSYPTLSDYLMEVLPLETTKLYLQHNRFNGSLAQGIPSYGIYDLKVCDMSYNNITEIPNDIFHVNPIYDFMDTAISIDFSYNPLMTGSLPSKGPSELLQSLYLHGCPLLRDANSEPPSLPNYIRTTDILTKTSSAQRYVCPGLMGRNIPYTFTVDPSYYSHQNCECYQGTYGGPPACANIPISVNAQFSLDGTSDDTAIAAGTLTDSQFGNDRMSIGIDVAWLVGASPLESDAFATNNTPTASNVISSSISSSSSSSTSIASPNVTVSNPITVGDSTSVKPVRAIYITFRVNTALFSNFSDLIEIFMGGVDLKGKRVAAFRGEDKDLVQLGFGNWFNVTGTNETQANATTNNVTSSTTLDRFPLAAPPSARLAGPEWPVGTIVVLNSVATISFRSRNRGGEHFQANFSLRLDCPQGYVPSSASPSDSQQESCVPIIPDYKVSKAAQIVVYALAAFVSIILILVLMVTIHFRNYVIFRAASIPFCICILLFGIILSASSVFYAITPEQAGGSWLCHLRPWLTCISLTGLWACLYVKVDRINRIFNNNDLSAKNRSVEDGALFRALGLVMLCQIALLIGLSAADLSHRQYDLGSGSTNGYMIYTCSSTETTSFIAWLSIQCVFIAGFVGACVITAYRIRDVPSAFNESSHLCNCIYVFCLITIIVLPINFVVNSQPEALILIRGMAQSLAALSMCASIFGHKLWMVYEGHGNNQINITQHTFGRKSGGGGSSGSGKTGTGKATSGGVASSSGGGGTAAAAGAKSGSDGRRGSNTATAPPHQRKFSNTASSNIRRGTVTSTTSPATGGTPLIPNHHLPRRESDSVVRATKQPFTNATATGAAREGAPFEATSSISTPIKFHSDSIASAAEAELNHASASSDPRLAEFASLSRHLTPLQWNQAINTIRTIALESAMANTTNSTIDVTVDDPVNAPVNAPAAESSSHRMSFTNRAQPHQAEMSTVSEGHSESNYV